MSKRMRSLSTVLAATAAAIAFSAAPAQAAPGSVYLYTTGTLNECTTTGNNGVNGGVFSSFMCQRGFVGYSLSVRRTPGHSGANVYLNTMSTLAQCQTVGTNGRSGDVFTSFHCQNGFVGYSLTVRD